MLWLALKTKHLQIGLFCILFSFFFCEKVRLFFNFTLSAFKWHLYNIYINVVLFLYIAAAFSLDYYVAATYQQQQLFE